MECQNCGSLFNTSDGIANFTKSPSENFDKELPNEIGFFLRDVELLGWKSGLRKFLGTLNVDKSFYFSQLLREKQAGWKLLLDFTSNECVLVIENAFGAIPLSLASHYDVLYILDFNSRRLGCIKSRMETLEIKNTFYVLIGRAPHLPFPSRFFDAVVIKDLENSLHMIYTGYQCALRQNSKKLLSEVYRILKDEGFVFLSIRNRFGYDYLFKRRSQNVITNLLEPKRTLTTFFLDRITRRAGFKTRKLYCLMPALDRTSQIVGGDCGANNPYKLHLVTLKGFLKQFLLQRQLYKYFSPALGIIASKSEHFVSCLDTIIEDIQRRYPLIANEGHLVVKQYLIRNYNSLILLVKPQNSRKGIIIRFPLDSYLFNRSRQNATILQKLNERKNHLPIQVPNHIFEGKYQSQPYFVETMLDGVSFDPTTFSMRSNIKLFKKAAQILTDFHNNTSQEYNIDETIFSELFEKPFAKLIAISGNEYVEDIEHIKHYLRNSMLKKKLKLVWMHGDFIAENILIKPRTLDISGLIDWDLSKKNALPLVDILCFIISNYALLDRKRWNQLFIGNILPLKLTDCQAEIFYEYMKKISIPQDMGLPLSIMFWIHHVLYRCAPEMKLNKKWFDENVVKVLRVIKRYI